MAKLNHLTLLIVLLFPSSILCQSDICTGRLKCGECLQGPGCAWCKDPGFLLKDAAYSRCNTKDGHKNKCPESHLITLPNESSTFENPDPSVKSTIQPKSYHVKLGVGQKINLTLKYTDPGNKPLDLYYLMDLSWTMREHIASVQKLGRELADALRETTTELQIGFGSFIDKPIMPYATVSQINPKDNSEVPTYGFKNHLSLTKEVSKFEETVRNAKTSSNLDSPEGVLDAMMQVIECKQQIGWRNGSHHVLVVSTDGPFHIAGDGKLAGIVIPNDGKCHLNSQQMYDKSTELDYPSISQIVSKIIESKTYTIFAVTQNQVPLYSELSSLVSRFAATEPFNGRKSNARDIISNQYKKIRAKVDLAEKAKPPFIQLKYFAKCTPGGSLESDTRVCENVGPESELEFIVQLELLRCPDRRDRWNSTFEIAPSISSSNEKLQVFLDLQCGCECEDVDDPVIEAFDPTGELNRACTNLDQGSVRCGICQCKENAFTGEKCQCPISGNEASFKDKVYISEETCKNNETGIVCSNRGSCECGNCVCQTAKGFSGKYCQCEHTRCLNPITKLECSGPNQGTCACERCSCKQPFSGVHCECENSEKNCKREGESTNCNGHGECTCNKCDCERNIWGGRFCDVCVASGPNDNKCSCGDDIKEYISCVVKDVQLNITEFKLELKNYTEISDCYKNSYQFEPLDLEFMIDNNEYNSNDAAKRCTTPLISEYEDRNCEIPFVYSISSTNKASSELQPARILSNDYKESLRIYISRTPLCTVIEPPPSPLKIVLGTSIGVVVIGILTLILWKIITYWHDKREYTRFEKERQGAKWDASGNPLYNEPVSTFQNPAYRE